MNILKRVIKAVLIWFVATLAMFLIFSPLFPTDTKMPLPISFFILIFPIFCAIRFSRIKQTEKPPKSAKLPTTAPTTPQVKFDPSIKQSYGPKNYEIVIFRKSQLQSSAKTYTIFIDGAQTGKLRNGGTLSIRTNVGTHRLEFKGYFKMETSFDFSIPESQKRTNIFTRVSLKSGKIFVENIAAGKQEHRQAEKLDKPEIASPRPSTRAPSLAYIDHMEGHDFEQFTANLLRKLGYERVQVTPGSGDQGVDVIAVKDGKKYAIQCKRYNQKLGNKPVQEVHAGKTIYGCNVAVVMTNNYFTDGGKEAARALGVELWDRDVLSAMLKASARRGGTQIS